MVVEELDDELSKSLIPWLLAHQQEPYSVHVRSVFSFSLSVTNGVQSKGNSQCDNWVLNNELGFIRRASRGLIDTFLQICYRAIEVMKFSLLDFRL